MTAKETMPWAGDLDNSSLMTTATIIRMEVVGGETEAAVDVENPLGILTTAVMVGAMVKTKVNIRETETTETENIMTEETEIMSIILG